MAHCVFDIVVVGAGPTGLLAALAFAEAGLDTAVCGQVPAPPTGHADTRTAALFNDSVTMLENLQVWPHLEACCAPLTAIRIIDDMGHLMRGPELTFDAKSLDLQTLGWNVPNAALVEQLRRVAEDTALCTPVLGETVVAMETAQGQATVRCESGRELHARLVVAADGQNSSMRACAGIEANIRRYPQAALTSVLQHTRTHGNISTEFHRPGGPFTVVPLPGNVSSLVWLDTPEIIDRAVAADDGAFVAMLEERLQGLLGKIGPAMGRRRFPLAILNAERLIAPRVALIGEAAHAFPPIGAQGLNLSFRDVAVLTETLSEAKGRDDDIGAMEVLRGYSKQRIQDIWFRSRGVDGLNRSLTSTWPGITMLRGGLSHIIQGIPALKQILMRAGFAGPGAVPKLMRAKVEA